MKRFCGATEYLRDQARPGERARVRATPLAVAAALLLAACGEDQPQPPPAAGATVPSARVELREVELTQSAEATVEAVRQSTVSSQIAGRIVDLRFDVGDRVQKGDVIARIDERAASQAVAASHAQVRAAEAAMVNARANLV